MKQNECNFIKLLSVYSRKSLESWTQHLMRSARGGKIWQFLSPGLIWYSPVISLALDKINLPVMSRSVSTNLSLSDEPTYIVDLPRHLQPGLRLVRRGERGNVPTYCGAQSDLTVALVSHHGAEWLQYRGEARARMWEDKQPPGQQTKSSLSPAVSQTADSSPRSVSLTLHSWILIVIFGK